jgi:hypothetical protein
MSPWLYEASQRLTSALSTEGTVASMLQNQTIAPLLIGRSPVKQADLDRVCFCCTPEQKH